MASLRDAGITALDSGDFSGLTGLTHLNLHSNQLSSLPDGTDAASFSIVGTSGQLQTSAALDFETKNSYSVTVSVSDDNEGSASINVTLTVTDVLDLSTPLNERTNRVKNAIVAKISGVSEPEGVNDGHLASIKLLNLRN